MVYTGLSCFFLAFEDRSVVCMYSSRALEGFGILVMKQKIEHPLKITRSACTPQFARQAGPIVFVSFVEVTNNGGYRVFCSLELL